MSDWLEGRLDRVLWASAVTGWAVLRVVDASGDGVVAVGPLAPLAEAEAGSFVALEGRFEEHPHHGRQFRCAGWLQGTPRTLNGLRLWLASAGVKGVGDALAARVIDAFGEHTPSVLTHSPERLREVPGIGAARAQAIRAAWQADQEGRALWVTLRGLGLTPRVIERVRQRWGEGAAAAVAADPYRLAEEITGVGFRTADALARQQGIGPDDPRRVRAAIRHVVDLAIDDGHCALSLPALDERLTTLGVPLDGRDAALADAEAAGRVVVRAGQVWSPALWLAEQQLAEEIARRAVAPPAPVDDALLDAAERWAEVDLDPAQRDAVRSALAGGFSVITGGPGTGKTTLIRVLLQAAAAQGRTLRLASPTGRAARRLEEATGQPASTIHRLLEFDPVRGAFQRNATHPIDGDGLVVDEASMVDLPLAAALLDALPPEPDFPVLWVGDVDQLPSVGPGQVLQDVIRSGGVRVARLDTVHRQGTDSGIVAGAMAILAGRVPPSGGPSQDLFTLARDDADAAREAIGQIVAERLPARGFRPEGVQVLAPTRKGPLGTIALNEYLQQRLNPDGAEVARGGRVFRVGDRVLCTKNRYDLEVFNGDVGVVAAVSGTGVAVRFDGRELLWSFDDLALLDLAYAITVHKSQGSEYPAVVLALHPSHTVLLKRNLFYTAITRARRFACVVGSPAAWARAAREGDRDQRTTGLVERLQALWLQDSVLNEK